MRVWYVLAIQMFVYMADACVGKMAHHAQEQIQLAIMRPEIVSVDQKRTSGVDHTIFVSLDKSVA